MARTVQEWLAITGHTYDPNDPLTSVYQSVAANNNPSHAPSGNPALIEACLRVRGMIYWKNSYGDCGTATRVAPSATQIAGVATKGIPVIGSVISNILGLFGAGHAQAVATEQSTICDVANKCNSAIPQIDAAVASGALSVQDAISTMQKAMTMLIAELGTIKKDCNAACVYTSVCQAHADFAKTYYPSIAPKTAIEGAVTALQQTIFGGGAPSPSGATSSQTLPSGLSLGTILAVAAVGLAVVLGGIVLTR